MKSTPGGFSRTRALLAMGGSAIGWGSDTGRSTRISAGCTVPNLARQGQLIRSSE